MLNIYSAPQYLDSSATFSIKPFILEKATSKCHFHDEQMMKHTLRALTKSTTPKKDQLMQQFSTKGILNDVMQ